MPRNALGKPIEAADYNRNDGFSPGSAIHTKIPGLDNQAAFDRTGLVPETDMARSFDAAQPAVVIDAETGERQLIWAELDSQAGADADRNLFIRPGTAFPTAGSVYEPWDAGAAFNALAPSGNTPPVTSEENQDPHGVPRRTAAAQDEKSDHLRADGTITDHCAGGPCQGVP
jgi:hypothetical protein